MQLLTDKEIQQLVELRWTYLSDEVTIALIPKQNSYYMLKFVPLHHARATLG